jgi:hypothetical protein
MTGGLERAGLDDWIEWVWIAAMTGGLEQSGCCLGLPESLGNDRGT